MKKKLNLKTAINSMLLLLILLVLSTNTTTFSQSYNKTYNSKDLTDITINSWNNYKLRFMKNDERVIDQEDNSTTSESQSYSLLRAIMMNDKNVFDKTYLWSKKNLQIRKEDKLFDWKTSVNGNGETYNTQNMNATDADLDIGMALVLADQKWRSTGWINYAKEARILINDIYKYRVATVDGLKVILPYNSQKWRGIEIINPSYFNPVAYKLFASYDRVNNWRGIATDSYTFINKILQKNNLIPDWVEYNYNSNSFENGYRNLRYGEDHFGYEAFRMYYKLNADYTMYRSQDAKRLLDLAKDFFESEYKDNNKIFAIYNKYGDAQVSYEDMTTNSAAYFIFKNTNSNHLKTFVNDKFYSKINYNNKQFVEHDNYYSSSWGWFALADIAGLNFRNTIK